MDVSKVINGTFGSLWVDNELWPEVDKFEAKVALTYEEINIAGSLGTHRKLVGHSGTGTMTVKKTSSRVGKKVVADIKAGRTPRMKLVGKLDDPDVVGAERVALYDVTIDGIELMKFEQKKLDSQDVAFAFSNFEYIDTI
ncbi:phage tail tube protein [Desulfosporosinus nitroreducens]|uniref:phage tail tube protein n=1 Tax=Desulfosporosinus nitroreducens TaxID=2018668 RepID=UPI00207C4A1C|nr:phage tail tube protein [Desulfosporosinus nitroreducens]MCO1599825.1 phage tail tube protein [Desulfosporosinus nitroreducens]